MNDKYTEVCDKIRPGCYLLEKSKRTIEFIADKKSLISIRDNGGYLVFHCHSPRFKYGKYIIVVTTQDQYNKWTKKERKKIESRFKAEAEGNCFTISKDSMAFLINTAAKEGYGAFVTTRIKIKYHLIVRLFSTNEEFPRSTIKPE